MCTIKLGYLFEMRSYSLILYKQYYVYLQLVLLLDSWKPQGIKKQQHVFLILQVLSNLCLQTAWPQSGMYL